MPRARKSQRKRRSRAYDAADWTTSRAKARFPFSLVSNVKLFYVLGALIMIGSVGTGAMFSRGRGGSTQAVATPQATVEATATATPGGTPAIEPTPAVKHYDAAPEMLIDVNKSYTAVISTDKGDIRVELYAKEAPELVNNFVFLARDGFYDGLTFHRVDHDFVAQGGDPAGDGTGGPGYYLPPVETESNLPYDAGVIAMARDTQDRVNGSQFFIAYAAQPHLNRPASTVFGKVVEGMDVLQSLTERDACPRGLEPTEEDPCQVDPPPGDEILTIQIEES